MKALPQTDFPSRFARGSRLRVGGEPAEIAAARPYKSGFLIRLRGVDDRNAAESLIGETLTVPERDIAPLPDGAYYHFQLIDMQVATDDGEPLGKIVEILETSANDVYVIRSEDGRELLIPAIRDVVLDVDADAKRMTVRLMPGLAADG